MQNKDKKTYFSIMELAEMLGMSRIAVYKKIKRGVIPAEKIGRAYAIPANLVDATALTEEKKEEINKAVKKVIKDYGETLKLLGKE